MKKISTILTIVLLLGGLALAGCEGPLASPGKTGHDANTGLVSVSFSEGQARTAFPEKNFAQYKFAFTKGADKVEKTIGAGDGFTFSLEAGSWTLKVEAFAVADEAECAASGEKGFAVIGGQTNSVTVELAPVASSGEGTLKLAEVAFNGIEGETPQLLEYSVREFNSMAVVETFSSTKARTATLDSGYYLLTARFGIASGEAGLIETIHIYRNLTTNYAVAFDKADFSYVRVLDVSIEDSGTPLVLNLNSNKTAQITATVSPLTASNQTLVWGSSDPSVATVDQNGNVTAQSSGKATITVTTRDGGKTAAREVTVLSDDASIAGITVNGTPANHSQAAEYAIAVLNSTASVTIVGSSAHNGTVLYKAEGGEYSADAEKAYNVKVGENVFYVQVTSEDGTKAAEYKLTVKRDSPDVIAVESVVWDLKPAADLWTGETFTFKVKVLPENATNQNLTWEVNPPSQKAVSYPTESGNSLLVTALEKGTGITITARSDNGKAPIAYELAVKQQATGISIDTPAPLPMLVAGKNGADRVELKAAVSPSNASDNSIGWASDNESVAKYENGFVVAVGAGTTRITATAKGSKPGTTVSDSREITVRAMYGDTSIDTLKVNGETVPLADGAYQTTVPNGTGIAIVDVAVPEGANKRVDGNASLQIGDNTFTITVTAENGDVKEYTLTVHRQKIAVSSITLSPATIPDTLKGTEFTVTAAINPGNASYPGVEWSNTDGLQIMSTSTDGLTITVKATAAGPQAITARSADDNSISKPVNVTVYAEGSGGINFVWKNGKLEITGNTSAPKGLPLTLTAPAGFDAYQWLEGGVIKSEAQIYNFRTDNKEVGKTYTVAVQVKQGSAWYQAEAKITVTE